MAARKATRRDLFRLLRDSIADAAGKALPPPPPAAAAPAPATEVPLERGRMVIDLASYPVPLSRGRRFKTPGGDAVLVVRVSPDHFAAVAADCPHCGGALEFDRLRDAAVCPGRAAAFRMDGAAVEGPAGIRLPGYVCHAVGPRLEIEGKPRG